MLNLFKTHENFEYIFIIPETAKVDAQGFYIIDESFKEANSHIEEIYGVGVWDYLAHDLEHRGLSVDNTFYDNNDYMNKKLISHGDYYLQFVYLERLQEALKSQIGYRRLGESTDPYLNDVPMYLWDRFDTKHYLKPTYKYAAASTYTTRNALWRDKSLMWSPSTNVTIAKQVGYILREKYKAEIAA